MATAKKTEYSVTRKFKLGESTYGYVGVLTYGTEYVTGGEELIESTQESRYKLPEKIDFMFIAPENGFVGQLVQGSPNKIELWGAGAENKILKQIESGATTTNGVTAAFYLIGR